MALHGHTPKQKRVIREARAVKPSRRRVKKDTAVMHAKTRSRKDFGTGKRKSKLLGPNVRIG